MALRSEPTREPAFVSGELLTWDDVRITVRQLALDNRRLEEEKAELRRNLLVVGAWLDQAQNDLADARRRLRALEAGAEVYLG